MLMAIRFPHTFIFFRRSQIFHRQGCLSLFHMLCSLLFLMGPCNGFSRTKTKKMRRNEKDENGFFDLEGQENAWETAACDTLNVHYRRSRKALFAGLRSVATPSIIQGL